MNLGVYLDLFGLFVSQVYQTGPTELCWAGFDYWQPIGHTQTHRNLGKGPR